MSPVKSAGCLDELVLKKKRGRPAKVAEGAKSQADLIAELAGELGGEEEEECVVEPEVKHDTPEEEAEEREKIEGETEEEQGESVSLHRECELVSAKYKEGDTVRLTETFSGIIKIINGIQYIITKGYPGDDDGFEYVWTVGNDETECIGSYEDGKIIEIEDDEE